MESIMDKSASITQVPLSASPRAIIASPALQHHVALHFIPSIIELDFNFYFSSLAFISIQTLNDARYAYIFMLSIRKS